MYMKTSRPGKAKNLDKSVVETTIKCFEDLIRSALTVGGRSRFRTIHELARQAEMLITMTGDRVEDHAPRDAELAGIVNGVAQVGNVTPGIDFGDDAMENDGDVGGLLYPVRMGVGAGPLGPKQVDEVMRQVIDSVGPLMEMLTNRTKFEARRNLAVELNHLMEGREKVKRLTDLPDKDTMLHHMDERIRKVLGKISKEDDDGVVPAQLLRGHQADGQDKGQGRRNLAVVGARDAVGEEGAGGAAQEGDLEGMGGPQGD